jgi:hypothetical protein
MHQIHKIHKMRGMHKIEGRDMMCCLPTRLAQSAGACSPSDLSQVRS